MSLFRHRRLWLLLAIPPLVLVTAGAIVFWPRGSTPVSPEEALAEFRSRQPDPDTEAATGWPAEGVYTYEASGSEEVKLAVMPTETREIPPVVPATVLRDGRGRCFELQIEFMAEHVEQTRYCLEEDASLVLEQNRKQQRIGALRPQATMDCEDATLLSDLPTNGEASTYSCVLAMSSGLGPTVDARLQGRVRVVGSERIEIGDGAVEAVHVQIRYDVSGDLTGGWAEDLWFDPASHLPVRIGREIELSGLANFHESSLLNLSALEPSN
ncbi:MAG: hypothetical protein EDR02_14020 [Actinobacteria bacterium]|nr:MAG: hypothetical protein EDR02_14020 [Actinomycetota bacterium]RIK04459.1 MAG: hypothetical protein DCC48_13085 [Acidobacteriota bacterium]